MHMLTIAIAYRQSWRLRRGIVGRTEHRAGVLRLSTW